MHEVLINRLGGLSLPRESVVRLTDRPDMTLDVYRAYIILPVPVHTSVLMHIHTSICRSAPFVVLFMFVLLFQWGGNGDVNFYTVFALRFFFSQKLQALEPYKLSHANILEE